MTLAIENNNVIVGEDVDERARRRQRDTRGNERNEPEEGTAVDEDEDDRDHECGCDEQGGVDGPENFDEIGEEATRSGDVDLEVGIGGGGFSNNVDNAEESNLAVVQECRSAIAVDGDVDQNSVAILGGNRNERYRIEIRRDLVSVGHLQIGNLLDEFADGLLIRRGELAAVWLGHHDQKRDGRAVGELGLLLGDER